MNKRKIMSSVVKSTNGVTYTPSLVTLEDGEDINSVHLLDTDILSGLSIQQIITSDITKSGVGQVDPDSDGTGEIFNSYDGSLINKATGKCSHAEGLGTTASGNLAHAEGQKTKAYGHYSHAEGVLTIANNRYEHAQGMFNVSNTGDDNSKKTIHSIGIGDSFTQKNALEVMANGDHYIYGIGDYDGTNYSEAQTVQLVINNLSLTELSLNLFEVLNIKGSLVGVTISSESALSDYDYIDFVFTGSGVYEFLAYRSSNNTYYRKWLEKKDTFYTNIWNNSDTYLSLINMLLMCKNDGLLYYFVSARSVSSQAPFKGCTPVYSLPTASSDTLGGVKIGSGLNIDDGGIVSITNDYITQSYADGKYATLAQIGDIETILDNIIGG